MKNYKYDYKRSSFKEVKTNGKTAYYIKVDNHYIKVDKSVGYYENIDLTTFFVSQNECVSIVDKIWINDLYNMVTDEIDKLSDPDNKIGKLAFIDEFNNSQISKILNIPRTTVSYRKKIIQKHLQQMISSCQVDIQNN